MQRVEYIDRMKGVCIILVVYIHILGDLFENLRFLFCFLMPMFFCLSGLFFKTYNSYLTFLKKKINTLLIPFIFFYILSYSIYFLRKFFFGSKQNFNIFDFFYGEQMFNISLWFLLSLFIISNIMYIISQIHSYKIQLLIVTILGTTGYWGAYNNWDNYLFIMTSLSSLPFYYLGYTMKNNGYLKHKKLGELGLGLLLIVVGFLIIINEPTPPRLSHFNNTIIYGNIIEIFIVSLCLVIGLMITLKYILTRGKYIAWIGNNSIVILVLHMLLTIIIYPIVSIFFEGNSMYVCSFFIILIICIITIPFATRFIPIFIGKKELIK